MERRPILATSTIIGEVTLVWHGFARSYDFIAEGVLSAHLVGETTAGGLVILKILWEFNFGRVNRCVTLKKIVERAWLCGLEEDDRQVAGWMMKKLLCIHNISSQTPRIRDRNNPPRFPFVDKGEDCSEIGHPSDLST
jgi:hypothetical protein